MDKNNFYVFLRHLCETHRCAVVKKKKTLPVFKIPLTFTLRTVRINACDISATLSMSSLLSLEEIHSAYSGFCFVRTLRRVSGAGRAW